MTFRRHVPACYGVRRARRRRQRAHSRFREDCAVRAARSPSPPAPRSTLDASGSGHQSGAGACRCSPERSGHRNVGDAQYSPRRALQLAIAWRESTDLDQHYPLPITLFACDINSFPCQGLSTT